jgi:hypothetical protein
MIAELSISIRISNKLWPEASTVFEASQPVLEDGITITLYSSILIPAMCFGIFCVLRSYSTLHGAEYGALNGHARLSECSCAEAKQRKCVPIYPLLSLVAMRILSSCHDASCLSSSSKLSDADCTLC